MKQHFFRFPALFLLTALAVLLCGALVSCQSPQAAPPTEQAPVQQGDAASTAPISIPVENFITPECAFEPMAMLTQAQKELLAELPVEQLPRESVNLFDATRYHVWQDTLLPMAWDEGADVTLYGVVEGQELEGVGDQVNISPKLCSDGIVLRYGGQAAYFPLSWHDNAWSAANPWMAVDDFDGDGLPEAAVCLYWAHGTGVSAESLYLFDLDTMTYTVPDYSTLELAVSYRPDTHIATVSGGAMACAVTLPEHMWPDGPAAYPLDTVGIGEIISFSLESGRLLCRVGLDFGSTTLGYLAYVQFPVVWDGGGYRLDPPVRLSATAPDGSFTDAYPLTVTGGRGLTLTLRGKPDAGTSGPGPRYDQIQIFDGDTLLQTIIPDAFTPNPNYDFDGFLAWDSYPADIRDVSFDGAEDFGVLCSSSYNAIHCWFVWDEGDGQFRYSFSAGDNLAVDGEKKQLLETMRDGSVGYWYGTYEYDTDGRLALVDECYVATPAP